MDAWLIALISGGLTLIASLATTYLNSRSTTRNLRAQLASEESRHQRQMELETRKHNDQREADGRARIFEYQRDSAVRFLSAMTAFQISGAKELGVVYARTRTEPQPAIDAEFRESLELLSGHRAAEAALNDAVSAVTVYLPLRAATAALKVSTLERRWLDKVRKHYLDGSQPDPGPYPTEISEALNEFRSETRRLLGVDPPDQVSQSG